MTRTKSMQPLQRTTEGNLLAQERQALCRTRSTFPRLTVSQPSTGEISPSTLQLPPPAPPQQQQQQQQKQMWGAPGGHLQHALSLGHPPVMEVHDNRNNLWASSFNLGVSVGNYASPPPPKGSLCATTLPDTSMPPPPPITPWGGAPPKIIKAPSETMERNTHKQLSRQLTINPTYDPRIHPHHQHVEGDRIPFPPPNFAPSSGELHCAVTRNASAPEQSRTLLAYHHPLPTTPTTSSNVMLTTSEGKPAPNDQQSRQQQQQHALLHRMSSTSDSQLHKTLSDMTLKSSWSPLTVERPPPPTAVSPLIGSSDGVWEATGSNPRANSSAADYEEARSKIYYHLAAIFPEEQVLRAMTAMPDETEADKICQYILCLNGQQKQ